MVDNRVAILTTIFPMNADYLNEFFASLASQTHSAFDVVVVNDGYGSLDEFFFRYPFINIILFKSPAPPNFKTWDILISKQIINRLRRNLKILG